MRRQLAKLKDRASNDDPIGSGPGEGVGETGPKLTNLSRAHAKVDAYAHVRASARRIKATRAASPASVHPRISVLSSSKQFSVKSLTKCPSSRLPYCLASSLRRWLSPLPMKVFYSTVWIIVLHSFCATFLIIDS